MLESRRENDRASDQEDWLKILLKYPFKALNNVYVYICVCIHLLTPPPKLGFSVDLI